VLYGDCTFVILGGFKDFRDILFMLMRLSLGENVNFFFNPEFALLYVFTSNLTFVFFLVVD
jgi:hypothetical protein